METTSTTSASSIATRLGVGSGTDMIALAEDLARAQFEPRQQRLENRSEVLERQISLASTLRNMLSSFASALGDRVRALHAEFGLTTVMVTHDMAEALLLADRVLVMDAGKIVADETPQALASGGGGEVAGEIARLLALARGRGQVNEVRAVALEHFEIDRPVDARKIGPLFRKGAFLRSPFAHVEIEPGRHAQRRDDQHGKQQLEPQRAFGPACHDVSPGCARRRSA